MKDPAPAKGKAPTKSAEGSNEGKKKFEVKKVQTRVYSTTIGGRQTDPVAVERRRFVGVGYCR